MSGAGTEEPAAGAAAALPEPPVARIEQEGARYEIVLPDADEDYIQKSILNSGAPYELAMLRDMRVRLTPGDLVLDIGANVGNHTLYLAVLARARVIAFEPNVGLTAALEASVARNGLGDAIDVRTMGLGRAAGAAEFARAMPDNLGAQSLALGKGAIEVATLDSLGIEGPVRMIKIDVEGMEVDVLEGAGVLIGRDRPLLYIESHDEAAFREVSHWIQKHGYAYWETFNATPTHLFLPAEQISLDRRIENLAAREVAQEYRLHAQLRRSRKAQADAAARSAAAEEEADRLKADLGAAQRRRVAMETEKQAELDALKEAAEADAVTLKAEAAALKTAKEAAEAEVATLKAALSGLKGDLVKSERRRATAEAAEKSMKARLAELRSSVTYQLGDRLKRAATSPREAVRLPGAIGRLFADGMRNRRARVRRAAKPAPRPAAKLPKEPPGPPPVFVPPRPLLAVAPALPATARSDGGPRPLRVAAVLDDFSAGAFAPEADLLILTPGNWRAEMEESRPDLIFIESAWHGRDGQWTTKISNNSPELQDILAWAAEFGVPTAFWNKEDPVHFQTFLNTARGFDHVFTTDMDCIHRYKAALGHDQVHFLPFACQPAAHNPLERYERKNAMSFAGSYYTRYPERTRDLETFVAHLPGLCPIEIFDRNFGKDNPSYQFPPEYRPYIVGTLPPEEIDVAYKGYRYAINLNSIKQSQTMFARRVFELLASNTLTVSNYSRGLRLMFGDLVPSSDDGAAMLSRLSALAADPERESRLRLMALRKVMTEHTYRDRLDFVRARVLPDAPLPRRLPHVTALAEARDVAEAGRIATAFLAQTHTDSRLILVSDDPSWAPAHPRVETRDRGSFGSLTLRDLVEDGAWLACLSGRDHYGPDYLTDLILATRYSPAPLIGKAAHFAWGEGGLTAADPALAYRPMASCPARRSILRGDHVPADLGAEEALAGFDTLLWERPDGLAVDPWSYAADAQGADPAEIAARVEDPADIDPGLSLVDLQAVADTAGAEEILPVAAEGTPGLDSGRLAELFAGSVGRLVSWRAEPDALVVESALAEGVHEYLYATQNIRARDLMPEGATSGMVKCHLEIEAGFMAVNLVLRFLDRRKERISHVMMPGNFNGAAEVPPGTAFVRIGLRVISGGEARIRRLHFAHLHLPPAAVLGRGEHLLIDTFYPAYDDLYRHGFVHTRVKAYRAHGVPVDVFCLRPGLPLEGREFEGVDVLTGDGAMLDRMLSSGRHRSALVHFLNPRIWEVVARHIDRIPVTVWVHGSEIQPWWRRQHDVGTEADLRAAKLRSDRRLAFWRDLLDPMPPNLKLVFVSQHFADEVMEDLDIVLPRERYEIIHNPIDTELFSYAEKPVEQRAKVLSVRPYSSVIHGNDLAVKAIELLSGEPGFKDMAFRMVGDGPLFEETLGPLRRFPNVTLEQRFLAQSEIAALHKAHGVCLIPTRADTQGVSRDEAMASGLVPVTNAVAAVPEFVDESCGILAPAEDAVALARGILELQADPERFLRLSRAASERVRAQSGSEAIITREIAAFTRPAPVRPCPNSGSSRPARLLIFGSCVSRDALEHAREGDFDLIGYFARSSMASAFASEPVTGILLDGIESAFQRRMVSADLGKSLRATLATLDPEVILHDPIDERFNLIRFGDGTLLTRSSEFLKASDVLEERETAPVRSGSPEFLARWEEGWRNFLALLDSRDMRGRLLVNQVFWATRTEAGGDFGEAFPRAKIDAANAFLGRLYERMAADLPDRQFIRFPERRLVGSDRHKWGVSPFHYAEDYYSDLRDGLRVRLQDASWPSRTP
jgi:FkbM family methyltransferase